jgi:fucose 4-O-acetylase-like acetyltransferase
MSSLSIMIFHVLCFDALFESLLVCFPGYSCKFVIHLVFSLAINAVLHCDFKLKYLLYCPCVLKLQMASY